MYLAIFLLVFAATAALTVVILKRAPKLRLLDVPNERSSHNRVTPRGGGLSIVVVFSAAVFLAYYLAGAPGELGVALGIVGMAVGVLGLADDIRNLRVDIRLVVQFLSAALVVAIAGGGELYSLVHARTELVLIVSALAVVSLVWFVNLYNFMDGIDGLAAVEAISISSGILIVTAGQGDGYFPLLLTSLVAAVCGFLVWNWPPAKIFLGDVGSGYLGFVLGTFALFSISQGLVSLWSWLVLAGVFLVDATYTLVVRFFRREKWFSAHRNHAYQKASRRYAGHLPVTASVLAINLVWLLPIAALANAHSRSGWWLTVIAWLPLIAACHWLRAGLPDQSDMPGRPAG